LHVETIYVPKYKVVYLTTKLFLCVEYAEVKFTYKVLFADMISPGITLPQNVPNSGAEAPGPSWMRTLSSSQSMPGLRSMLRKSSLMIYTIRK